MGQIRSCFTLRLCVNIQFEVDVQIILTNLSYHLTEVRDHLDGFDTHEHKLAEFPAD